jgi:hypothetical protein
MPIPVINIEGAKSCPNCGKEKGVTEDYIQSLKDAGYLPKKYNLDCLQLQAAFDMALQSPVNIQQIIPVLIITYRVCECGMIYWTKIQSIGAKLGMPPPQSSGEGEMGFPKMKG